MSGSTSFHAGESAETSVARSYEQRGFRISATRYKTRSGEIDLIAEQDGQIVFIEVKKSKSHARAAERLSSRQMLRIYETASEFLATCPDGQDTSSRFDVALVDAMGKIEILENAFAP
ncbi:MAG: YraN family protein [Pseudomonadota bacterium]